MTNTLMTDIDLYRLWLSNEISDIMSFNDYKNAYLKYNNDNAAPASPQPTVYTSLKLLTAEEYYNPKDPSAPILYEVRDTPRLTRWIVLPCRSNPSPNYMYNRDFRAWSINTDTTSLISEVSWLFNK